MREIVLRSGEPMTIENSYRFYRRPRRAGIRRSLHKLWIRAPHVTAQIAGRLQPKRNRPQARRRIATGITRASMTS